MRIGIFGHYGNQNLGDEAIIEATIDSVRRHFKAPEIICFSPKPNDTALRHNVPAYPILERPGVPTCLTRPEDLRSTDNTLRDASSTPHPQTVKGQLIGSLRRIRLIRFVYRVVSVPLDLVRSFLRETVFLFRSFKVAKSLDLMIIAGSNQFLDNFGGITGFPLTLLKWSILCKLARTKLAFVSVGAGPINSPISMALIRFAARFADYLSYRDQASKRLVEGTRRGLNGLVYPDLAMNLRFPPATKDSGSSQKPTVGINPMPMYDSRYWCEVDDQKYKSYVDRMAELSSVILNSGFPIFFFGTQVKDYNVINDIVERMISKDDRLMAENLIKTPSSVQGLMEVIQSSDIVIATRFHGTVLSVVAGKPVLGICYYRKAADLLRDVGQASYFVMLDDFRVEDAFEKFRELVHNRDQEKDRIERAVTKYQKLLEEQYKYLSKVFSV